MRVVIVGAGPCGLTALKELRASGLDAIILERTCSLGGSFLTINPDSHLTLSNWAMAFSDFPDPARLHYPSAKDYLSYLQRYSTHFNLENHISFNTEVRNASLTSEGTWALETFDHTFHTSSTVMARFLIVATGTNSSPKPFPKGLTSFEGHTFKGLRRALQKRSGGEANESSNGWRRRECCRSVE